MQYIRDISNISKALFSVLMICVLFLFSSQSFAKNDSHSSLVATNVNVELNSVELNLDDNDSSDPAILYKNNICAAVIGQRSAFLCFDYIPAANNYSINVRAPPLN